VKSKNHTSSLMVKQSMSTDQDSWLQKLFSTQVSSKREMKPLECTPWPSQLSKNVILILEKIFIKTSSSPEEPPFIVVFQIDLRRSSMLCAHNKTWSKLLQVQIDTTPSGLVVPLFHLSQPSRPNGSPRKNMKKVVLKSCIENACENIYP